MNIPFVLQAVILLHTRFAAHILNRIFCGLALSVPYCNVKHIGARLTIIVLSIFIFGCQRDSNIAEFVNDTNKSVTKPSQKPVPIYQYKAANYAAYNARDPFINILIKRAQPKDITAPDKTYAPDFTRQKELLEKVELGKLTFIGFVQKDDLTWALLQDYLGIVHQVKKGSFIGKNYGIITDIDDQRITVEERFEDRKGNWVKRRSVLKIKVGGDK